MSAYFVFMQNPPGKEERPHVPKKKYCQRPDGLYEAIRIVNGKRKAFRGHTPHEVEQKMIAYQGEVARGRLFREVADDWEAEHFPTLSPNTLRGYRPAARRAVERFGDTPIRKIKAPDIKRFITEFARPGVGQASRAQKTVTNQLLVTSLIFRYAAENGEIEYNPCANVTIPKALPKTHREAASPIDEQCVKAAADVWLLPYLILYTGLRKGEALALTYGDLDFRTNSIHVTKSVYHWDNKPHIKRPKTEAGIRAVPILEPLLPKLPRGRSPELYLFSDDGGKTPLSEMQYQHHWSRFAEATGITCTAHQLRHSFATMLFECGLPVKDKQDILGHSTATMTEDIYTHIRDSHRAEVAQQINEKLREK